MGKSKPFTYRAYISIDGAEPIPLESMTPEQEAHVRSRMCENLSHTMSEYYSLHPDEYQAWLESEKKRERVERMNNDHV